MSNRLALMGSLIVALSVAYPSVVAAQNSSQNPWRTAPQATGQAMGQYAPSQPAPQALQVPTVAAPKYAPLDGKLISEAERARNTPDMGALGGAYPGTPYGPGYGGYGAPLGYGGYGYPGLGYSGLGYPGLGYPGLGGSGLGWGGYGPASGWGNGLGGPTSWMPFW